MKLQYLGTGGAEGFPGMFCACRACRLAREQKQYKARSCSLLNDSVLIDLSPDLYVQSLRFDADLTAVLALVVTHSHRDHLDLFGVCLRARDGASLRPDLSEAENRLPVFGGEKVLAAIRAELDNQPHANRARLELHPLRPGASFRVQGLEFYPIEANHKPDEQCFIFAVREGQNWLLYANDTGALPQKSLKAICGLGAVFDVVSMDCARGTLPGDGHMGLAENIALRDFLRQNGCVKETTRYYLNHFSHMCGLLPDEMEALAAKQGFTLARDGMILTI